MATALSFKALALAALLSVVVVTSGARAEQQLKRNATTASQDRSLLSYSSGWLPAKATWYGAPTGAGPVDNGKDCNRYTIPPGHLSLHACRTCLN
jgi:hypothetical protein